MSDPITRSVRVQCSLAHAFTTFTERVDLWWPPGHRRFDGSTLTFEARVGGRFFERKADGTEAVLGSVINWDPPNRLTYTWQPGSSLGPTEVDIRFRQDGESTVVEVVHSPGYSGLGERWPEAAKKFASAWSHVLPCFTDFVSQNSAQEQS